MVRVLVVHAVVDAHDAIKERTQAGHNKPSAHDRPVQNPGDRDDEQGHGNGDAQVDGSRDFLSENGPQYRQFWAC